MASSEDEVVIRLKVASVAQFLADVQAGKIAVDDLSKSIVKADAKSRMISDTDLGGLGLMAKAAKYGAFALAGTTLAAAGVATAVGVMGIKAGSSAEQAKIGFTTLLGSSKAAQMMMSTLNRFAIVTPFQLDSLRQTASMMLGMGFSAQEIVPDLTAVGDAMSGLGRTQDDVNQVGQALGKMLANGKVNAREMNELTIRGVNAWQILADKMGVSVARIRKLSEEGKLPARQAIDELVDGMEEGTKHTVAFGGLMSKQAHSLAGLWSNTSDAIKVATGNMMTPLFPFLERKLSGLNKFIPAQGKRITATAPDLGQAIKSNNVQGIGSDIDIMFGDTGKLREPIIGTIVAAENLWKVWRNGVWPAVKLALSALAPLVVVIRRADSITGFMANHSDALRRILITLVVVIGTYKTLVFVMNVGLKAYNVYVEAARVASILFGDATKANTLTVAAFNEMNAAQRLGIVLTMGAQKAWTAATVVFRAVNSAAWWVIQKASLLAYKAVTLAVSAATKVWTGIQWAFNAAMDANPVSLIVIGVVLLVAAIILAYKHSQKFQAIVHAAMHGGRVAIGWVVDRFMDLWHWIRKVGSGAGHFLSGMWDGMRDGFKSVMNWIISRWDALHFQMPSFDTHIPGVGKVGGFDIGVPQIPLLATGGTATAPGMAWVGEQGPELVNLPRGASVIPLPKATEYATGGASQRPIHTHVYLDRREIAMAVTAGHDDALALL